MSLKNITTSEARLILSIFVIFTSLVIFFISMQKDININCSRIERLEHNSRIQQEMYFNLKTLFDQNGWKWISFEVNNG